MAHLCHVAGVPQVSPVHKIYFKDMFQRQVSDPMKLRLVFRYPEPCYDCDEQVCGVVCSALSVTSRTASSPIIWRYPMLVCFRVGNELCTTRTHYPIQY